MGLETNTSSRVFLSISDGKIAQRFNEEVPDSVPCTNKDGSKTWFEKRFSAVSGFIQDIQKRETDWGARLSILIEDKGELFQLEMPWSSRYSSGFFLCMPNIDFRKKVTFSPWMKIVDGEKKTNLYINQEIDGKLESVKWYWTKDDPKGLPPMVQLTVKGEKVWDDTERQVFFENYIEKNVRPVLMTIKSGDLPRNEDSDKMDIMTNGEKEVNTDEFEIPGNDASFLDGQ